MNRVHSTNIFIKCEGNVLVFFFLRFLVGNAIGMFTEVGTLAVKSLVADVGMHLKLGES